jgi:hypothetical protein
MRRAPWYLVAGAIAGFAGVLGFHTRTTPQAPAADAGAAGRAQPSHHSGQPGAGTANSGSTPGPAAAGSGTPHSATGPTEPFNYGQLAVRVTVSGHRITNVTVPTLQTAEPFSQQLVQQAIPTLRAQVLAADGASINGVSGATFVSQAYAQSLQAALDKLHVK